ncbi:MAG: hypothetical protein K2X09_05410 [Rickettsiales bacterium]|nr:hypothetical protein [Rickettsiales bacterium]
MKDDATLVIVLGYDQPNKDNDNYRTALAVESEARNKGRNVVVIGDGTYAPTLEEIHKRVAAVGGPAEVYLAAHGENIPKEAGFPELGNYAVTLSDGKTYPPETIATLANGASLDRSQVVNAADFLKALPSNTTGVMLGTCYSASALPMADLLPKGAKLFVTSTETATTLGDQSDYALQTISHVSNTIPDGSSLTEVYGFYVASFKNKIEFTSETWQAQTPTKFAISGEGTIDLADAAKKLKGYEFPAETYHAIVSNIYSDTAASPETQAKIQKLETALKVTGDRVTSGEFGSNQALDNRSYNTVLTEIARVANSQGVSMTQALESMEQQAASARANAPAEKAASPTNIAPPESSASTPIPTVKSLGAALMRDPKLANVQQNGAKASADPTEIEVPAAAVAQGQSPPTPAASFQAR